MRNFFWRGAIIISEGGLNFFGRGDIFLEGLAIFWGAGLRFFRVGLGIFSGGVGYYSGGRVDILLGGVDILSGGLVTFFGGGGVKKY